MIEKEESAIAFKEIIDVLSKHKLKTTDLILVLSNVIFSVGTSIEGIDPNNLPTLEELQKKYYTDKTIGTTLMLQGLLTKNWHEDLIKQLEEGTKNDETTTVRSI